MTGASPSTGRWLKNAIVIDARSRDSLMAVLKEKTGLENPNSVIQMIGWLEQHGMKTDSLGKKQVEKLLKTAEEPLRSVLLLRQKLAKSSVRKYQAMGMTACEDGRARGMFQFYGANRTGGLPAGTSSCRIFPRIICRIFRKPGNWYAREITKPWNSCMIPSPMSFPS